MARHTLDDGRDERRKSGLLTFEAWHPHEIQLGVVFAEYGILSSRKCEGKVSTTRRSRQDSHTRSNARTACEISADSAAPTQTVTMAASTNTQVDHTPASHRPARSSDHLILSR